MYRNKCLIASPNGYNYDYDFIIIKVAKEFTKQFACLGENIAICIILTVPVIKDIF